MKRNILDLLCIAAQIYPMLQSLNLSVAHGVMICVENMDVRDAVVCVLEERGARKVELRSFTKGSGRNYIPYFADVNRRISEEKVMNFLEDEKSMSILIGRMILPEWLADLFVGERLIFTEEDMLICDGQKKREKIQHFVQFVRTNPALIFRTLRLLSNSLRNTKERIKQGKLWLMLRASVEAWSVFYRENHSEEQTLQEKQKLIEEVNIFSELPEQHALPEEIGENVGELLVNYVQNNEEVLVGKVDEVDLQLFSAIQDKKAILQKDDYYYVPEELLRAACKPLENVVSFLEIKRGLYQEGYLLCQNRKGCNYTIKLLITNVVGYTSRPRFLKFRRELFESSTSIGFRKEN